MSSGLAEQKWNECLEVIKDIVNAQKYSAWFEPIKPVKLEDSVLTIEVPSQFWYEWLEQHYYSILRSTIAKVIGEDGKIEYSVRMDSRESTYNGTPSVKLPQRSAPPQASASIPATPSYTSGNIRNPFIIPGIQKHRINSNLNSNYNFDRFIEGDCNKLARSAAMAIAESPGSNSFNPFFI